MNPRTFDSVIENLNSIVAKKQILDENKWLEAAQYINLLLEDEQNSLFLLEQKIAQMKCQLMENGDTVAKAKVKLEATDEYLQARKQKARIERAIELIRIAKLQSRTSMDIYNSNGKSIS